MKSENKKRDNSLDSVFQELFEFESENERLEHEAKILASKFLTIIDKCAEDRNLSKKDLGNLIGTSSSYITQLFRGNKLINLTTLAKFQSALDIKFEVSETNSNPYFQNSNLPETFTVHKMPLATKMKAYWNKTEEEKNEVDFEGLNLYNIAS